jgi:hypothetical protein
LNAALKLEEQFSPAARTADQRQFLSQSLVQFWDAVDRMFDLAAAGKEKEARDQIQLTLQARQSALSTAVSRLLCKQRRRRASRRPDRQNLRRCSASALRSARRHARRDRAHQPLPHLFQS